MPTYEYLCRSCGDRIEVVQSFSDDALSVCDACGGELRKVFSAAGLIFKGSGWHVKDYAAGAKGASGGTGGSSSAATKDSSSGGGSDGGSTGGSTGTRSEPKGGTKSEPKGESKGETKRPAATTKASSSD
jgi:putative FmdB family regulatory protein